MNTISCIALLLAVCALLAAAVYDLHTRRVSQRLDEMLDAAIQGGFTPSRYDESHISRTESKLSRFLTASVLSRDKIETDRKQLAQTIGDISHQTRTPIANIKLYAELLQEQDLNGDARELAEQIGSQSAKLEFLIQALVKTSRLETGVVQPAPEYSMVAELLEVLESSYRSAAEEKGLSFSVSCPPEASARFDRKWTAEALGNFVDNAIKYTDKGNISISVQQYELFCRVDVSDTGIGIPEAEQAAIFQRFYRGEEVRQRDGVGIGLYLARQIISAQGGYVKVRSAPGQGAVFSIFLPRT